MVGIRKIYSKNGIQLLNRSIYESKFVEVHCLKSIVIS